MTTTNDLNRLAELTTRYARYSRSAGGISLIVGGILCLLAFVLGATIELTQAWRYALAGMPFVWLLTKELLRVLYYQRYGSVSEKPTPEMLRAHKQDVIYLFVISSLVTVAVLWRQGLAAFQDGPTLGYLLLGGAVPFVAMRWFWSVSDFLVGVLLFCQAAVVIRGGNYGEWWIAYAALCAATAITFGVREHLDFLKLRRELGFEGEPA